MGRFRRSLSLFGISFRVLREHRGLIAFPLVSLAASLIVAASFLLPVFTLMGHAGLGPVGYAVLFCGYVVLSCVTAFCNAALIDAANTALNGGSPTLRGGFAAAAARKGAILGWGAFSGTVSLVLRAAEQRLGPLGRFIAALGGLAWTMVTYLVLPVIVLEGVGPRDGVKRSSELLRRTWGPQIGGIVGVSLGTFILALPAFFLLAVLAAAGGTAGLAAGLVLCAGWLLLAFALGGAVAGIFQTALYRFAADGTAPAAFADAQLCSAVRQKRRRWGN
jgi:hypothetical protein